MKQVFVRQAERAGRWLTTAFAVAMAGLTAHAQNDAAATKSSSAPAAQAGPSDAAPPASSTSTASTTTATNSKLAQPPRVKDAYKPLVHAQLVVWLVEPSGAGPTMVLPGTPAQSPITYQERTPSGLGQSASTYGTDAGKFGVDADSRTIARVRDTGPDADAKAAAKQGYQEQTSGSFGQNSANYGDAASNHGQTSSSYGQTAGNYGIDASNYGVDASDYGHSLSNLTAATEPKPTPVAASFPDQLQNTLATSFPAMKVHYVNVGSADVKARLRAANATKEYPDVVILDGFATSWPGFPQDVRDALLPASAPEPNRNDRAQDRLPPSWYVTRNAPHTSAAHALSVYLDDAARTTDGK